MKKILLLWVILLSRESFAASNDVLCLYTVKKNESLISILSRLGIGTKGSPYPLYESDSYFAKTLKKNADIEDWRNLSPGQQLVLVLPKKLEKSCSQVDTEQDPVPTETPTESTTPSPSPIPTPPSPPTPSPLTTPSATPTPQPPTPKPKKIVEKLTPLLRAMYGISLAPKEYLLLTKMSYFSLVYQFAYSWKWHLSLDVLPPAADVFDELHFRASSYRLSGGPILVLPWRIKVIPKIHYWSFDGDLPLSYEEYLNVLGVKLGFVGIGLRAEWDQPLMRKVKLSLWGDSALDAKILQKDQTTGVTAMAGLRLGYQLTKQWSAGLFGTFEENRFFHGEVRTLGKRLRNPLSDQPNRVGESASTDYRLFYAGAFVSAMW